MQIRKNPPSKIAKFFMAILEVVLYLLLTIVMLVIVAVAARGLYWIIMGR